MAQNWHFWSIWARLIQCPVDGSVGGCGARAVSRKTPIYFIVIMVMVLIVVVEVDMRELDNDGACLWRVLSRNYELGKDSFGFKSSALELQS